MNEHLAALEAVRDALRQAVDAEMRKLPQYNALRDVEAAIEKLRGVTRDSAPAPRSKPLSLKEATQGEAERHRSGSYADLGLRLLAENDRPATTVEVIEYVGRFKPLTGEPVKDKANITSGLSRDPRLQNILWRGGRYWWFAHRDPPAEHGFVAETKPAGSAEPAGIFN